MNRIVLPKGRRIHRALWCAALLWFAVPQVLCAQESISVTVTPPLFQLAIAPGESWASALKIVNNNSSDLVYYARVLDFTANGEDGSSKYTPLVNEPRDSVERAFALSSWITLPSSSILVEKGTSKELPFMVDIPLNAEPGGHYAAILVGTDPGEGGTEGSALKVSSFVSSLLFVKIRGEEIETGRIREFSTKESLYQSPQADFTLRFENTGNVHVQPQGDITIYNMWGKERGKVLINQDSNFGNVLPKSIRKFQFSWEGERQFFEVGPYRSVVTLAYGENNKKNLTATTYFWIVPIVPVAIGLSSVLSFVLLMAWLIRRYIRRALSLEKARLGLAEDEVASETPLSVIETFMEPIREGVIDLRNVGAPKQAQGVDSIRKIAAYQPISFAEFVIKYKLFFIFIALLIGGCIGLWVYFDRVLAANRSFQITDVQTQAEDAPLEQISQ